MTDKSYIRQIKPDDELSKHTHVSRQVFFRSGYHIKLAVKVSSLADESTLEFSTDTANIFLALEESYDEAKLQGYPLVVGVISANQIQ